MTLGLNLATGVLTARMLGPEGRGSLGVALAWIGVSSVLAALGSREGFVVVAAQRSNRLPAAIRSGVAVSLVLGVLGVVLAQIAAALLVEEQHLRTAIILFAPLIVLLMLQEVVIGLSAVAGRVWTVMIARLLTPGAQVVGLALLGLSGQAVDLTSVLWIYLAAAVLATAFSMFTMRTFIASGHLSREIVRPAIAFGLRAQGLVVAKVLNARLDLLVLPLLVPLYQVGQYAVATSVSTIVVVLFGRLSDILLPRLVIAGPSRRRLTMKVGVAVGASASIIALILGLAADFAIPLLYGDAFSDAGLYVQILLPGTVLWAIGTVAVYGLQAEGRPGLASLAELCGLVVTVLGLVMLVPSYGVVGACITSACAYGVAAGVSVAAFAWPKVEVRSI